MHKILSASLIILLSACSSNNDTKNCPDEKCNSKVLVDKKGISDCLYSILGNDSSNEYGFYVLHTNESLDHLKDGQKIKTSKGNNITGKIEVETKVSNTIVKAIDANTNEICRNLKQKISKGNYSFTIKHKACKIDDSKENSCHFMQKFFNTGCKAEWSLFN